jgi:ribosome-associated toxin RatA of RatAB toxin-antitoxin module
MRLSLIEGPFQSLTGAWRFTPLTPEACKVEFVLDYAFANPVVEGVLGPVMATIAETFVDRFVQRADALYGDGE